MENLKKFCKEKSITFFFPIALVLTIVPLIVRMRISEPDEDTLKLYGSSANSDLFTQNKEICLIFLSAIILIIAITCFKKFYEKKDKLINIMIICSLVFLGFTFLSALFSKYKHVAFWGIYDRSEGFITIACYILLFIYSIYTFKKTEEFKFILIPILILVYINGFLGLFQFFGSDLIKTSLGGLIAIPSSYNIDPSKLSLAYESGTIYGTLYHYNYVGSFTSLVLPILFGACVIEDDIFLKLLSMGGSLVGLWLLFGSTSRAGIIGFGSIIFFACIFFGKLLLKKKKALLITLACLGVFAVGLNFATSGKIFRRIPSLVADGLSLFKDNSDFDYRQHIPVQNIQHIDNNVVLTLPSDTLTISYENNDYVFRNSKNEVIDYKSEFNSKIKAYDYTTTDANFSNISFRSGKIKSKIKNDGLMLILNGSNEFMFITRDDNSMHLIDPKTLEEIDLDFPKTIGFNGKEKLASSRGYIWSRSIPLLKDTLILGSGPDTFSFDFPQHDLLGKFYAYGTTNMIISKAHNLFLQIGLNNGVVALIAFVILILIYIVDSFRLYALKNKYDQKQILGSILALSILGYLFTGIFNDSVICVAPIFWIILGVGVAVNFINKKAENK
ncbi:MULTISPECIES: O-antigen ligase family protein [Clostridium]|uniref:O-antigen ligase family protein n=1 Tax=Clostridium TaxID=1485 RepID=UPI001AA1C05F|nr:MULTISPECIES: O-antigen ligase family protein [Clostridium]MBO1686753.1 O-antigen ligase family protein [Clostridium butyricum]MCQ2015544.1 O-antigen ligase family protein [Clostridium butyricum]MCQ2024372.1 O-antigen ligase family protein [Clostridium butyricum]MDU1231296.1 O-antigen ligase family protein [Clostridium sp.]MDU3090964.1 O-antigen ligase family protein [Clostridium sp.]